MANTGKLTPNLDQKSTKVLNLTVLQRIDPSVMEIIFTAAHVTFYEFNIDSTQWSRKDVEGSFFVVKRNTQPRFQFIVMNRLNTDNLVENLLGDFEYEVQLPYLLYRNASQEVNGIWFYNPRECEEVANLFSRILNAYSKVPTKSKVSSTKSDFEELEDFSRMAVMDGPLEPSLSINSNVSDGQDDPSFVNFFSVAMNNPGTPKPAVSGQPYHSSATVISTSRPQPIAIPILPTARIPSPLCSPNPTISMLDIPETNIALTRSTDLIKPSSFFGPPPSSPSPPTLPPVSPSVPNSPPINAPLTLPPLSPSVPKSPPINSHAYLQRPYGAPLLQPFPPPTPPPSLTPSSIPQQNYGPVISREKVREALQILVQDNKFIDMVYRAMMNAHQSSP